MPVMPIITTMEFSHEEGKLEFTDAYYGDRYDNVVIIAGGSIHPVYLHSIDVKKQTKEEVQQQAETFVQRPLVLSYLEDDSESFYYNFGDERTFDDHFPEMFETFAHGLLRCIFSTEGDMYFPIPTTRVDEMLSRYLVKCSNVTLKNICALDDNRRLVIMESTPYSYI